MDNIIVVLQESDSIIVEVGVQGPVGPRGLTGAGHINFDTTEAMFAFTGAFGNTACCADQPAQFWKWDPTQTSTQFPDGTWVPAF